MFGLSFPNVEVIVKCEQAVEPGETEPNRVSASTSPAALVNDRLIFDFDGPMDVCAISVYPRGLDTYRSVQAGQNPRYRLAAILAHELYHCVQFNYMIDINVAARWPPWLTEGSAAWAGRKYAYGTTGTSYSSPLPGLPERDVPWDEYLGEPEDRVQVQQKSLFSRSYDSVGFFAHIENVGANPWTVIPSMLLRLHGPQDFNELALSTAVALGGADFLQRWATGLTRMAELGPMWDTTGPGITDYRPVLPAFDLDSPQRLFTGPATVSRSIVRLGDIEDRVLLAGGADSVGSFSWRDRSGNSVDEVITPNIGVTLDGFYQRAYCLDPVGCVCRGGAPLSNIGIPLSQAPTTEPVDLVLAFTGGVAQGVMSLASRPVDELCGPSEPQDGGDLNFTVCDTWMSPAEFSEIFRAALRERPTGGGSSDHHSCNWILWEEVGTGSRVGDISILAGWSRRPPDDSLFANCAQVALPGTTRQGCVVVNDESLFQAIVLVEVRGLRNGADLFLEVGAWWKGESADEKAERVASVRRGALEVAARLAERLP
jgi:hypothetical protein